MVNNHYEQNHADGKYADDIMEREKADVEKKYEEFEKFKNEKDHELEKEMAKNRAEMKSEASAVKEKIEKIEEDIKKDLHK